jgi:hypothetical protein
MPTYASDCPEADKPADPAAPGFTPTLTQCPECDVDAPCTLEDADEDGLTAVVISPVPGPEWYDNTGPGTSEGCSGQVPPCVGTNRGVPGSTQWDGIVAGTPPEHDIGPYVFDAADQGFGFCYIFLEPASEFDPCRWRLTILCYDGTPTNGSTTVWDGVKLTGSSRLGTYTRLTGQDPLVNRTVS